MASNENKNQNQPQQVDAEKEQLLKQIEALQKANADAEARASAAEKSNAEAEAKLAEMQNKAAETKETPAPDVTERVEVFVPRGSINDEPNLLIAVNGVNYLLPKGKQSLVPKFVAEEYERSKKAQNSLDMRVDDLRSKD